MRKHIDLSTFKENQFRSIMLNLYDTDVPKSVGAEFTNALYTFKQTNSNADFDNLKKCFTADVLVELCKAYLDRGQIYAASYILERGIAVLDEQEVEYYYKHPTDYPGSKIQMEEI